MSDSKTQSAVNSAVAKAYVREMLDLNPMWSSAEIIRRRREIWTGDSRSAAGEQTGGRSGSGVATSSRPGTASDPQADQRLRDRAKRCLEVLESSFYTLPEEKLNQYLRFLQSDRLPEFAAKAMQLQRVAKHRSVLIGVRHETQDEKFTFSLLQCLVGPASKAGALREQYLESIIADRRVGSACGMIKDFVSRHPEIYDLERDWFDLLLDPDNQRRWSAKYSLTSRYKTYVRDPKVNLVAVIAVLILASVSAVLSGKSKNAPRKQSMPTSKSFVRTHQPSQGTVASDLNATANESLEAIRKRMAVPSQVPSPADLAEERLRSRTPTNTTPESQYDPSAGELAADPNFGLPANQRAPQTNLPTLPSYDQIMRGRLSGTDGLPSGLPGSDPYRGRRPGASGVDDAMKQMRDFQEQMRKDHEAMIQDIESFQPTSPFMREGPGAFSPSVRPPDFSMPKSPGMPKRFGAPGYRPGREPAYRPGQLRGTRLPGGMQ